MSHHLPDKAIQEYKEIYRKEFGKDISDGDARAQAEGLVRLTLTLTKIPYTPVKTKDNYEELELALRWKRYSQGPKDSFAFQLDLIERCQKNTGTPTFLKAGFKDAWVDPNEPLRVAIPHLVLCGGCRNMFEPHQNSDDVVV